MGAVLRFISWVATQVWRWGVSVVNAVINWVRKNWQKVQSWLEKGVAWGTIVQWIMQILGLG